MGETLGGLKQSAEQVLRATTLVDANEIRVEADGARVTLSGTVDSALEKRRARQIVEDLAGVEIVDDQLQIRNFVRRPDAELAEEVRHRLQRDAYTEEAHVEVYASNGEIRLDGEVPTYRVKKAVEDVTWWTPGVIGVENLLLVSDEEFVDVEAGPSSRGA